MQLINYRDHICIVQDVVIYFERKKLFKRSLCVWQISPPGWRSAGGNVAVFGRNTKKKEGVNFKRNFVGDGWRRLESCCLLNRENRKSEIQEIAAEMSTTDEVRFSEGRLNQVKSGLETWREVVIKLDSVLGKLTSSLAFPQVQNY